MTSLPGVSARSVGWWNCCWLLRYAQWGLAQLARVTPNWPDAPLGKLHSAQADVVRLLARAGMVDEALREFRELADRAALRRAAGGATAMTNTTRTDHSSLVMRPPMTTATTTDAQPTSHDGVWTS